MGYTHWNHTPTCCSISKPIFHKLLYSTGLTYSTVMARRIHDKELWKTVQLELDHDKFGRIFESQGCNVVEPTYVVPS